MKSFKSGIPSSEITPEHVYLNRRAFMKASGIAAAATLLAACAPGASQGSNGAEAPSQPEVKGTVVPGQTDEFGSPLNTEKQITNYNNYYEFTTSKEQVALLAANYAVSPWNVEIGGLVNKPKTYAIEDLVKQFPSEERVYRLRCVEAWSMVIPWMGFPLADLLKEVEPTGDAKYVKFTSILDPEEMTGQRNTSYPWPYTEGLRIDEAMHDLTLMVTGLYGKTLPAQNGAPLRLAVPWKYGFKSIKGIVKIELVAEEPPTLWSAIAPNEYGFYANVNPTVDHPRWSQASERRIGEAGRRETLMFNGYSEQVASLYEGMDLEMNY